MPWLRLVSTTTSHIAYQASSCWRPTCPTVCLPFEPEVPDQRPVPGTLRPHSRDQTKGLGAGSSAVAGGEEEGVVFHRMQSAHRQQLGISSRTELGLYPLS